MITEELIRVCQERFMTKVSIDEYGCWIWNGGVRGNGYGHFWAAGKDYSAHRASYELFVSEIPEGFHIDHLCQVPSCVNPKHLDAVTPKESILRSACPSAQNARKTHCPKGHLYDRSNGRRRFCRVCRNAKARVSAKAYYWKNRDKIRARQKERRTMGYSS